MSNIVSGGGWSTKTETVEEKVLIRGRNFYLIWNVLFLFIALPVTYFYLMWDNNIDQNILWVFLGIQLYFLFHIIKKWKVKTHHEIHVYEDQKKLDYNEKNLY
jgi:hypothetical protein